MSMTSFERLGECLQHSSLWALLFIGGEREPYDLGVLVLPLHIITESMKSSVKVGHCAPVGCEGCGDLGQREIDPLSGERYD